MPTDMAAYMAARRQRRREQMRERLGGRCTVCGVIEGLDFDHIDPSTKVAEVSTARMLDGPLERLIAEVDKCQLLCRDHHVAKTAVDRKPAHGTEWRYLKHRCRCGRCVKGYAAVRRGYASRQPSRQDSNLEPAD